MGTVITVIAVMIEISARMESQVVENSLNTSPSHCTTFLSCVITFRVIVLAWNRPRPLQRLLTSLERSDYTFKQNNPGWEILVAIRVDGGGGT